MSEFDVGDKVRIVANHHGHGYKVGAIVTIAEVDEKDSLLPYRMEEPVEEDAHWLSDTEIESRELKFKVGDKVRVIEAPGRNEHDFPLGTVGEVMHSWSDGDVLIQSGSHRQALHFSEVEHFIDVKDGNAQVVEASVEDDDDGLDAEELLEMVVDMLRDYTRGNTEAEEALGGIISTLGYKDTGTDLVEVEWQE